MIGKSRGALSLLLLIWSPDRYLRLIISSYNHISKL